MIEQIPEVALHTSTHAHSLSTFEASIFGLVAVSAIVYYGIKGMSDSESKECTEHGYKHPSKAYCSDCGAELTPTTKPGLLNRFQSTLNGGDDV